MTHLERIRAQSALRALSGQRGADGLEGLPIALRSQGLVSALSLLRKRSPQLVDNIAVYLTEEWPLSPVRAARTQRFAGLIRVWCELGPSDAALVEAEALHFAEVLKALNAALSESR